MAILCTPDRLLQTSPACEKWLMWAWGSFFCTARGASSASHIMGDKQTAKRRQFLNERSDSVCSGSGRLKQDENSVPVVWVLCSSCWAIHFPSSCSQPYCWLVWFSCCLLWWHVTTRNCQKEGRSLQTKLCYVCPASWSVLASVEHESRSYSKADVRIWRTKFNCISWSQKGNKWYVMQLLLQQHVKTWDFFTSPSHLLFVIKFSMRNPTITTVFNLDTWYYLYCSIKQLKLKSNWFVFSLF